MIVNESFKKGLIAGLSMNPLHVGEGGSPAPEKPKPVVRLELNGNLDNTGTDDSFTVSTNGVPITYEEGLNGKQCYSAKVINEIRVNGDFASLFNNECTLIAFAKPDIVNSTLYRCIFRMLYRSGVNLSAELYRSSDVTLRGNLSLSFNGTQYRAGMTSLNNEKWVCVAMMFRKGMLTLWQSDTDNVTGVKNDASVTASTTTYVGLSHYNSRASDAYYLRGCIQDFRVYDKCLSYDELKEIAKEGGL